VPFEYREAWIAAAVEFFKPEFEAYGYPFHAQVRVTCGWPSRGGLAPKKRTVGECWSTTASADGANEIFISPVISDPVEVVSVLLHELVHAAVGTKYGHGEVFRSLAVKMGLTGPMRSTFPSPHLKERLNTLCQQLGRILMPSLIHEAGRSKAHA
jgi:SprT-like family